MDVKEKAGDTLLRIKQTGSVEAFNKLFGENRYLADPKVYTEGVCKELYWNALKPQIKLYISRSRMKNMNLGELMSAAQESDRELQVLHREMSTPAPNRFTMKNKPGVPSTVKMELGATTNDEPSTETDIPDESLNGTTQSSTQPRLTKLTPEEREYCRKKGLCFRCRKPNHMVNSCPLNPKK